MASLKRQSHLDDHDRDGEASGNESKRRQGDSKAKRALIRTISDIVKEHLETLFRKVVQEEVPPILERHLCARQSPNQTGTSGGGRGKNFQLSFTKRLPREIFTMTELVADDKTPLEIAVYQCDGRYQNYIVTDGPLSSMKIELFVLDGKLGSKGSQDLTSEEFSACIKSKTRNGAQLLMGDRFITLTNGVGCIPRVYFNDISKCASNGKFSLGARVVGPVPGGADIREAISESFKVKHKRGEGYKNPTPQLNDEIWHLNKIAKGGKTHEQLSSYEIKTINDLLLVHNTNLQLSNVIIGKVGKKTWEKIIKHAQACASRHGGNCYTYHTTQQANAIHPYLPIGSHQDFSVPSTSTLDIGEAVHNGESELGELVPELSQLLTDENFAILDLPSGDAGQYCSNHSSYSISDVYTSTRGKGTTVWDKIRNTLIGAMLYIYRTKRKAKRVPHYF